MTTRKVLVVRNDRLGDFMLAWPAFALLKTSLPDCRIEALAPEYTRPLAEICPWVDGVVIDPAEDPRGSALTRVLKKNAYDAIVTLFSTPRVGIAAWRAGITIRIAPATKAAQIFYNQRVAQRRSRSEKPEFVYNLELAEHLVALWGLPPRQPALPYLRFDPDDTASARQRFIAQNGIDRDRALVFIHAGSGGSSSNLAIEQYATLASQLNSPRGHVLVLCAGPGELESTRELSALLTNHPHVIFESRGLVNDARCIAFADLFICGSTGPLHIAGALNRPTTAFYPRRRSATALRWQTLNDDERRLAFAPPADAGEDDMNAIDLQHASREISERLLTSRFPFSVGWS